MTKEGKVKAKVKSILQAYDVYYFMPATGGFGKSGVADFIACFKDHFIAIECKTVSGEVTALQQKHLMQVQAHGGHAIVVNEENYAELELLLQSLT
jgi:hypothetical protein